MRVLVTGAAGYIGSVVTEQLIKLGIEVVALDNLQQVNVQGEHSAARFVLLDLRDAEGLAHVLRDYPVDAVVAVLGTVAVSLLRLCK